MNFQVPAQERTVKAGKAAPAPGKTLRIRTLEVETGSGVDTAPDLLRPSYGSIRLASLFLTLPTRAFTGQQVISSDGNGASRWSRPHPVLLLFDFST